MRYEKTITLLYKNWHTDEKVEMRHFKKFEDAEKEAGRMIKQFKYWGGGCVPVIAIETIWTKTNGCHDIKREGSKNTAQSKGVKLLASLKTGNGL